MPGCTPLFDAAAQRAADMAATNLGLPSIVLMERAGLGAAGAILDRYPGATRCTVLVGVGNNGGDGMVIARHLADAGLAVRALAALGEGPSTGDGAAMTRVAQGVGIALQPLTRRSRHEAGGVLVDAVLGTGTEGAPRGGALEAVGWAARHRGPVVAIDVPTGVEADTGRVPGPAIVADLTVTFGGDAVGLRVAPGLTHAGHVEVVDIGIPSTVTVPAAAWLCGRAALRALPGKAAGGEKYRAGAALVVGGAPGLTGAPALAARAVLRAGGGLSVAAIPAAVQPLAAPLVPEVMFAPVADADGHLAPVSVGDVLEQARRVGAVALGPGLGRAALTTAAVRRLLEELELPTVVDADGLWHLGERPAWLRSRAAPTVLTPHAGEAGRLLGRPRAEVEAARLDAGRELAEITGAVVALKGPGTVVCAPGEAPIVNATGSSALSTAGTGDVLTGTVVAQLAKGLPARTATALAVALHGVAGELSGYGDGTLAGDVAEALPAAREATAA